MASCNNSMQSEPSVTFMEDFLRSANLPEDEKEQLVKQYARLLTSPAVGITEENHLSLLSEDFLKDLEIPLEHATAIAEAAQKFGNKDSQPENTKTHSYGPTVDLCISLIKSADRRMEVNPRIVLHSLRRFPSQVNVALSLKDKQFLKSIYEDTEALPQTETEAQLALKGYQLNRSLNIIHDSLLICFRDTVPCVLKTLSYNEAKRIQDLPDLTSPHIVKYVLEKSSRSVLMIMPLLPATLQQMKKLSPEGSEKLWTQMGDALECLHSAGFAHMDIKPSNICINHAGDFILIDLGSTVRFGRQSMSTKVYVPQGVDTRVANPAVDWWMLAATLGDKACGMNWWGSGAESPTPSQLLSELEQLQFSADIVAKLKESS